MANIGNPFENSCILMGVGVLAIIVNSFVITNYGRRRVFMVTGLTICGISQFIVAAVYTAQPGTSNTGKVIIGISILYLIGYNGCLSSYSWLAGGEIPSQRLRSYTFGLATAIGFFGAVSIVAPDVVTQNTADWGCSGSQPLLHLISSTLMPSTGAPSTATYGDPAASSQLSGHICTCLSSKAEHLKKLTSWQVFKFPALKIYSG